MRIDVSTVQGDGFTAVTVSHKGKSIEWSTRAYSKVKLADPSRVFLEFNEFLTTIDETAQDKMFSSYESIKSLYEMGFDPSHITASLIHHIVEIGKQIPMNKLRRWLLTIGNLHIPADIQDTITADSRYNKREQTYLKNDYINLSTVALGIRAFLPVLGEYMDQGTDQDLYKENDVVGLLSTTELANWPMLETDQVGDDVETVFEKLESYIRFCVEEEHITLGRLWSGLSTVKIRELLQSKVLIRRLTIVPLNDPTSYSIVSNIFRYVNSNLNPTERSTSDRVNDKQPDRNGGDDEDNTSFIEAHKTKSRVSPGDIVAYNLDAMDYELLAEDVDPTICKIKLAKCIDCIQQVAPNEIRPHQVMLAQWVMAKAFPSRAFYHIDKLPVNYLLATTQALLWHWGHLDTAIFMQVEPLYHGDNQSASPLGQLRIGSRIATKYRPMLDELFPHMKHQRIPQSGEIPKPENRAAVAINSCNHSIRSTNWAYKGPDELFREAGQVTQNKVLILPPNLKHSITEVVMQLAQINK
ncbi:hypothetical protein PHABIO_104 [Pseudomonas phage Phabio]|uniref:Uncharacterized protein n=1 Tax=Pseudomonas phage Phabio TaxID=2006668 RepID=A0A1Y0SW86_9CAUD|nr:hypothetical protein MZD05_gp104 [Pseudomonas phage Phabio]ARV76735.1 hypothetical protein PHABIO_104 [Pseudomonas phage Phabio]